MHPMVKHLVNAIADGKEVNWPEVERELNRITISDREKKLCLHLKTMDAVQQIAKGNYNG